MIEVVAIHVGVAVALVSMLGLALDPEAITSKSGASTDVTGCQRTPEPDVDVTLADNDNEVVKVSAVNTPR